MSNREIRNLSIVTRVCIFLAIVISTELGSNVGLYLATIAWLGLPSMIRLEDRLLHLLRRR